MNYEIWGGVFCKLLQKYKIVIIFGWEQKLKVALNFFSLDAWIVLVNEAHLLSQIFLTREHTNQQVVNNSVMML